MIEVVAEHSVDLSLIKRDSKVLDLGCRYFGFANEMLNYVDEIYCVEPDKGVKTEDKRIHLASVAVGSEMKMERYCKYGNGTGNFIYNDEPLPEWCEIVYVPVWTLPKINHYFGVYEWDLIKCDIEGEEWDVLMSLTHPVAKQISFEMHQHTGKKRPLEDIHRLFNKLSTWYDFKVVDESEKHGCGKNFWDVLIVKKNE